MFLLLRHPLFLFGWAMCPTPTPVLCARVAPTSRLRWKRTSSTKPTTISPVITRRVPAASRRWWDKGQPHDWHLWQQCVGRVGPTGQLSIKWKLGSKWPHDLNLVKVWWVAAEKIEPKAESCFEGHRPWNEFFWTFFFKFLQLWKWAIWMYGKIFKQRPKGRSPGLYMAFLALKIYSSSMMNRNSCSFQISTKSD